MAKGLSSKIVLTLMSTITTASIGMIIADNYFNSLNIVRYQKNCLVERPQWGLYGALLTKQQEET